MKFCKEFFLIHNKENFDTINLEGYSSKQKFAKLEALFSALPNLEQVIKLSIKVQGLLVLPSEINYLTNLSSLNFSDCSLYYLRDDIGMLTNLKN